MKEICESNLSKLLRDFIICLTYIVFCPRAGSTSLHITVARVYIDSFTNIWYLQFNAGSERQSREVMQGKVTLADLLLSYEGRENV